jgi:putative glutamine amidotransferase
MQPIVGITSREKAITSVGTELPAYTVFRSYTDGLVAEGAIPVLLVPTDAVHIDNILDRVDGVVLTGGGDIEPDLYGEHRHATVRDLEHDRDAFELELIRRAHARRIPTFAICRGMQVVNVAFGGSLIQDLPSQAGIQGHDADGPEAFRTESTVRIDAGSKLAAILGPGEHGINSAHHQAVGRLGEGLKIVGTAPDGTIEAVEHVDEEWDLLAVQWHPELLGMRNHEPSHALFRSFVESAAKYQAGR